MWSPALPRRAPRCTDCRTSTVIAVAAVIGQPVNQHPTVTDRTIRREVVRGHEPSLGLDDCEGSTGLVRGDSPMSPNWHEGEVEGGAKPARLCTCSSDVNLFSNGEGIIDFDAEIPDCALNLRMSQQQ